MATLHFFGGEKGGVGKSFVARTAAQSHLDRGIDFALFDADRGNPDVKRIYGGAGCGDVIFSESEKERDKANVLYSSAQKKTTLVNLPPQVGFAFKDWFERKDLLDPSLTAGIKITHWFVSSGEYWSLRLFNEYLDYFGRRVNHVLVKNWGLCDEWSALEANQVLQQKISDYGVKILDFPKFVGNDCRCQIDAKSLTFGEAREIEEFGKINQHRIKTFLERGDRAFDEVGFFGNDVEPAEGEEA